MIIVKLMGGLGNQMFQYAAGRCLSLKYACDLKLDLSFLLDRSNKPDVPGHGFVFRDYDLDIFDINIGFSNATEVNKLTERSSNKTINKVLNKLLEKKASYYKSPYFHFDPSFFNKPTPLYLDGYWQSDKFFKPVESVIRKDFEFKEPILENSVLLAQEISQTNSICVNVRRGDFVGSKILENIGVDYYMKADKIIKPKINTPQYYVFSDDIEWCTNNLRFFSPVKFISHLHAGKKFGNYLHLMSLCKHFIIPNSSFAWWAAWLSSNSEKIVIAPEKWFNEGPQDTQDLIPEKWIKI